MTASLMHSREHEQGQDVSPLQPARLEIDPQEPHKLDRGDGTVFLSGIKVSAVVHCHRR
jgi:hypothetical protein